MATKDWENVPSGTKPIPGLNMWKYAYYLQYLNDKASCARDVCAVVNERR